MQKIDFEKLLGCIFLVLIFSAAALIAADRISIRFFKGGQSAFDESLTSYTRQIRVPKPYVMFSGQPHARIWGKQLNELGYREEAPKREKPADELRVIVLGGSEVFMGNPSLPRLIQYQFEQQGCSRVKVYNFGVVSSVTGMELARLVTEVVDYKPDIVISFSGFNDMTQPLVADPRPGYPYNFFIYENNPVLENDIRNYQLVPLVLYGSNICRRFLAGYFLKHFADIKTLRQRAGYGSHVWQEEIAETYVNNLRKSARIARAFGAEFIVFFQPSLYFKSVFSEEERQMVDPAYQECMIALKRKIMEKIDRLPREEQFCFVDMGDFFKDHAEVVFKDQVHVKQIYRPAVAKAVYDHLLGFIRTEMPRVDPQSLPEIIPE